MDIRTEDLLIKVLPETTLVAAGLGRDDEDACPEATVTGRDQPQPDEQCPEATEPEPLCPEATVPGEQKARGDGEAPGPAFGLEAHRRELTRRLAELG